MHLKIYLLIFHFAFCAAEPLTGGNVRDAAENEFPFVVSIGDVPVDEPVENYHFCTGALISQSHVLTAAHCLESLIPPYIRVTIGSHDLRLGQIFAVSSWITFDQWVLETNGAFIHDFDDVAILKLATRVTDPRIVPARISTRNSFQLVGTRAFAAGWGGSSPRRFLKVGELEIVRLEECENIASEAYNEIIHYPSHLLCSKADPPAYLECGDSGGPLLTSDGTIIAINFGSCPKNVPDHPNRMNIHTDIDFYRRFIIQTILQ